MFIACDLFLSNYALKDLVHSYFDGITVENGAMENKIQFLHRVWRMALPILNKGDVSPNEINTL